jgi:predicted nucleotidyltransferase
VTSETPTTAQRFDVLLNEIVAASRAHYGDRLVSLAAFGSVGRGTARPDSDVDLLIVADDLPPGRLRRADDFRPIEHALAPALHAAVGRGFSIELSPVFKTPAEIEQGSPLLLDMTEDARILHDRGGFLREALSRLSGRLRLLGARRIWRGNMWFWDLKPGYRPGDVIEL